MEYGPAFQDKDCPVCDKTTIWIKTDNQTEDIYNKGGSGEFKG